MSKFHVGKSVPRSLAYGMIVVLMLGPVLSGCAAPASPAPAPAAATATSAPVSQATSPAPTQAPAGATKQGDRLVVAVYSFANESPFGWENSIGSQGLWGPVFDPFVIVDPKTMELKPGLFTEWKPSADNKTWTFKVRQGVMFHNDYGELTAEDIKFFFDKNLDPKAQSEQASTFFIPNVEKIEAPDKYTLVMYMKAPGWSAPYWLDTYVNTTNIQPKKYFQEVGEAKARLNPIGTGPYKFVEGKPGDTWRFQAVPGHWRVTPSFKELVLRRIPEESARLAALRSGEIDAAMVDGDSLAQAKKAGIRILETPNVFQYWASLAGQTFPDKKYPDYHPEWPWVGKPGDQKSQDNALKVRQALNLAVNKKAIIDNIWQGYGNDGPFVYMYFPEFPGFSNEWKVPPYDPQKAKQLLAEAGYPNGFEITMLLTNQAPDGSDIGEAIAMDWEKVGLTVKREKLEIMDLISRIIGRSFGSAAFVTRNPPSDVVALAWQTYFGPNTGGYSIAENAEYDTAMKAILGEFDPAKRTQLQTAFGQKLYDDYRAVRIGTKTMTWAVSKKVGDWPRMVKSHGLHFFEYITWSGQ